MTAHLSSETILMSKENPILCTVDKWYFKRMGLLTLMLSAFVLWFLYDAYIGYPKQNVKAEKKEFFDAGATAHDEWKTSEQPIEVWLATAEKEGYPIQDNGEPQTWASYSSKNGLKDNPKKHNADDILQQKRWAGGFGLGALAVAVTVLLNRNKKIEADADSWTDPGGNRISFDSIYEIDKRKWDNKGLAYLRYRDESGAEKKATLDDLKYTGADKILERIMANFKGDLIETIVEEDDEPEEEAEQA